MGRGSDQFMLRLPDGMREQIKQNAALHHRSMNAEIVHLLEGALENEAMTMDQADVAVRALLARVRGLECALRDTLRSALYPEGRSGYETREEMEAAHAKEREAAVNSYPGARDAQEAVAMSHRQAWSIVRGATDRLDQQHARTRAALAPPPDAELCERLAAELTATMARYDAEQAPDDANGMAAPLMLGPEYVRHIIAALRANAGGGCQ